MSVNLNGIGHIAQSFGNTAVAILAHPVTRVFTVLGYAPLSDAALNEKYAKWALAGVVVLAGTAFVLGAPSVAYTILKATAIYAGAAALYTAAELTFRALTGRGSPIGDL